MLQRLVVLLAILPTVLIQRCIAATCYGYDGSAATNNQVCPGSNACCGASATCLSNRLCHNVGDGNGTFVRGPCAVKPYDPQTCAEICLYDEVNGFFPRVTVCDDGSYCCNNDVQCCGLGNGVFLDSTGATVASLPSSTGSIMSTASSITSASASATSVSSTSTSISSPLQTPSSTASTTASSLPATSDTSSSLSTGAKIGLGVGVPLGVLVLGILASTLWYQRRRIRIAEAQARDLKYELPPNAQSAQEWQMHQQRLIGPQELDQYKLPIMMSNDTAPVELPVG